VCPENDEPRDEPRTRTEESNDPAPELARLVQLATRYPEIGPPLAGLAFKIGQADFGNQILRMGLEAETPGIEYNFVAVTAARRAGDIAEALARTVGAVKVFAGAPDGAVTVDDGVRLLHLVRLGFANLLFDVKDLRAHPSFVEGLAAELPRAEARLGQDPFYHSLLAQVRWYTDRAASEAEWDRAAELAEPELTWNARGTWYKEAEQDVDKAEQAYRRGLGAAPRSALLAHNLAQLLIERAPDAQTIEAARATLREADDLLRTALREDCPKGLRRHIHATRARLNAARDAVAARRGVEPAPGPAPSVEAAPPPPAPEPPPPVERFEPVEGLVIQGRVCSLTAYGAFVTIGGGHTGLLHKSEMAWERIEDPAAIYKIGDEVEVKIVEIQPREGGRPRIGLSRKVLLPAPAGAQAERPRPPRRDDRPSEPRREPRRDALPPKKPDEWRPEKGKLLTLGEMLLAKLKEQEQK
jgi:predicted RNA-binding protein with RPS1 domain